MKRFPLAALLLAGCVPQLPTVPSSGSDALAVRYEVRIGQAVLANVRSVHVDGPDIELIEFRDGTQPQGAPSLMPGRIGMIKLVIQTDWAAAEQTMEAWRGALTGAAPNPTSMRRTIAITITSPGSAPPATYSFQRCLPSEHDMQLAAQDSRIDQTWRVTCEGVLRS
jgi:hypothetical protein